MTLDAAARYVGVRPGTARTYLNRVKAKYDALGRPAFTKLDLAVRVREDALEVAGMSTDRGVHALASSDGTT